MSVHHCCVDPNSLYCEDILCDNDLFVTARACCSVVLCLFTKSADKASRILLATDDIALGRPLAICVARLWVTLCCILYCCCDYAVADVEAIGNDAPRHAVTEERACCFGRSMLHLVPTLSLVHCKAAPAQHSQHSPAVSCYTSLTAL